MHCNIITLFQVRAIWLAVFIVEDYYVLGAPLTTRSLNMLDGTQIAFFYVTW